MSISSTELTNGIALTIWQTTWTTCLSIAQGSLAFPWQPLYPAPALMARTLRTPGISWRPGRPRVEVTLASQVMSTVATPGCGAVGRRMGAPRRGHRDQHVLPETL